MNNAIKYFIQNNVVVNLLLLLIILIGLISFSQIRSTNEPLITQRNIIITAVNRGASPEEVENGIIDKIEENLKATKGIKKVTSQSSEGFASLNVEIKEGSDINFVLQDVKDAVEGISSFPEAMETPIVTKVEMLTPTYSFSINGDVSLYELKDYAEAIKDDLLDIEGISTVNIYGLPDEEIEITVSENKLREYNLSVNEIINAVVGANIELTGGTIKTSHEDISLRARSKNYYAQDLEGIIVRATTDGAEVHLSDVTTISNRYADKAYERFFNKKPSVAVEVMSRNEENYLENSDAAAAYVVNFNKDNKLVKCEVIEDASVTLRETISVLVDNGILGFALVFIFLSLFLQRRLAIWVALKIPVAFLGMLTLGSFYDLTFNMLSLFGFILVLGILVDDGIVVGENIYQHFTEKKKSPLNAAFTGTAEVSTPVIISLLTTGVAFSLFFFLPGKIGDMFSEMAFVVIGTLIFALIESFFILPSHIASSLKKPSKESKLEKFFKSGLLYIRDKWYLPLFKHAIGKFKWLTIVFFVVTFISSIALVGEKVIFTFFPGLDDTTLVATLELKPGTSKNITHEILEDVENQVWACNDELTELAGIDETIIKNSELILGPNSNEGQLKIILKESEGRVLNAFEITNVLQARVNEIPEAVNFTMGGLKAATMFGKPVSFSLYSKNIDELRQAKDELKAYMKKHRLMRDVTDNDKIGNTELIIALKPQAQHLGLTHGSVMQQIRNLYFGVNVQTLQRGEDEVKVWLRYDENDRKTIEDLENMEIVAQNGKKYPFSDIATFEYDEGVLVLNHTDNKKEIRVEAELVDINVSAPMVIQEIEASEIPRLLEKYSGLSYSLTGQSEKTNDLGGAIATIGPIILLLILALIIFNGKSFSQAAAVFVTFPFVITGVIYGHWIQGSLLSMFSMLGVIALLGVYVNNALVFTSSLNDNLASGMSYYDSLIETAKSRFRPIVLTSITTVVGLAPTLFSNSMAITMVQPPAVSISYGLLFGLLLPLFLLPVVLILVNNLKRLGARITTGRTHSAEEVEAAVKHAHTMHDF